MLAVYGLKNCDTCRKATKWLTGEGIDHTFVDVRKEAVGADLVSRWAAAVGWEKLLNRQSTTWRGLADADKDGLTEARAVSLMVAHPSLIKRPVFDQDGSVSVGFKEADAIRIKQQARR